MKALTVVVGFALGLGAPILLFGLIICGLSLLDLIRG